MWEFYVTYFAQGNAFDILIYLGWQAIPRVWLDCMAFLHVTDEIALGIITFDLGPYHWNRYQKLAEQLQFTSACDNMLHVNFIFFKQSETVYAVVVQE